MIPWNGEEMTDPRLRPHEAIWVEWHDFQAGCTWYQCRNCFEKFYITDEFKDNVDLNVVNIEDEVNGMHDTRIERLARRLH